MISPTMMMETEVDTDTDTIEETDNDKNNIYEEVLNNETYRRRNNHSKLSTTSSIYRSSWWEQTSNVRYNEVCFAQQRFSCSLTWNNFAELSSSSTKSQCAKTETLQNCKIPARPPLWALQFLTTRGGSWVRRTAETIDSDKRRS